MIVCCSLFPSARMVYLFRYYLALDYAVWSILTLYFSYLHTSIFLMEIALKVLVYRINTLQIISVQARILSFLRVPSQGVEVALKVSI